MSKINTNKIYAESIVNEYSKKEDSKVVQLKKLDRKAKLPANLFGYIFGSVMTLIFGTGMCVAMGKIGGDGITYMIAGVVIGVVGIVGCVVNYFIYKKILKNSKEKYAGDIIELAKQIAQED